MLTDWYDSLVLSSGRSASLWMMIGFLLTYAVTRRITRKIRARSTSDVVVEASGPKKDIHIGGVDVHLPDGGILQVLVTGLLAFLFPPASPWLESA